MEGFNIFLIQEKKTVFGENLLDCLIMLRNLKCLIFLDNSYS